MKTIFARTTLALFTLGSFSIFANLALAETAPQAYRITKLQSGTARSCLKDLEISNLNPKVGDTVYLFRDSQGTLTFTDSPQSTVAFVVYPVGRSVANPGLGGGPQITYDGAYLSPDLLQEKEKDSDGQTAVITIKFLPNQIDFRGQFFYNNGAPAPDETCTLDAI